MAVQEIHFVIETNTFDNLDKYFSELVYHNFFQPCSFMFANNFFGRARNSFHSFPTFSRGAKTSPSIFRHLIITFEIETNTFKNLGKYILVFWKNPSVAMKDS